MTSVILYDGWLYPCTVTMSRYGGGYSGGRWLAFPLEADKLPEDWDGDDYNCGEFWANYKEPVGKGDSPEEAYKDLISLQDWSKDG